MEPVKIYYKHFTKITIITNFSCIFSAVIFNCYLLDPDPGGKRNEDPCGSGTTALH